MDAIFDGMGDDVYIKILGDSPIIRDILSINKDVLKELIKRKPAKELVVICVEHGITDIFKYVDTKDIPTGILNRCRNQATIDYLLANIVDLEDYSTISPIIETWVLDFIVSKTLKVPFNPNRAMVNGFPFWFSMNILSVSKSGIYRSIDNKNFSQPLDINAQTSHGNTYLHFAGDIPDDFLALNPRHDIINSTGKDAITYRKWMNVTCEKLQKYIESNPTTNEILLLQKRIKELEERVALEVSLRMKCEAKQEQLRALIM